MNNVVNNVLEMPQAPQWGAFAFIKMPQVLLQLHTTSKGKFLSVFKPFQLSQKCCLSVVLYFTFIMEHTN